MAFQRKNQRVSATDILQEMANGQEIKLSNCTISGELDVNRLFVGEENFDTSKLDIGVRDDRKVITIAEQIEFDSCTFEGNVCLAPPWEKPDALEMVFKGNAIFNSSVFKSQTRFSRAIFEAIAGFDGCTFESVASFRQIEYRGVGLYRTTLFEGYGLFDGSVFLDEARFTNTCFCKGGNFTNVRFEGVTDFAGVYSRSKSVPVYETVTFARKRFGDDETFWRFIKQASQEAGHYQLAGEAFYNERCAHLCRRFHGPGFEDLSARQKIVRYLVGLRLVPELILGRLLFGYGERPVRVLVASALIIVLCGLYYSYGGAQIVDRASEAACEMEFWDGLYFSTITFTTLGFGDMYPVADHLATRFVAMSEALAGACLMALFVVTLAKRFSRG